MKWARSTTARVGALPLTSTFASAWGDRLYVGRVEPGEARARQFHTRLYRIVPELQFSPWIASVNNISTTRRAPSSAGNRGSVGFSSRGDLYVVYMQNWLDDPLLARIDTLDRRLATEASCIRAGSIGRRSTKRSGQAGRAFIHKK